MENTNDIMTSLRVASQTPLDRKAWCINEDTLKDFGTDDQLCFTYHKGLKVICIQNRTTYEWKEIEGSDIGLRDTNFTYPLVWIVDGIDYSNKVYNFIKYLGEIVSPFITIDEGDGEGIIIRDRNPDNFGPIGFGAIDFSKRFTVGSYGAKGWFSVILNGQDQEITSTSEGAIIGAGFKNYINAKLSAILGGSNNIIDGTGGGGSYFIGGGYGNAIYDNSVIGASSIVSGNNNIINTYYANIVGGDGNIINILGIFGFIGNGDGNTIEAYQGFIGNGTNNKINANLGSILNGVDNIVDGLFGLVLSGTNSNAKGSNSIVINGSNTADSFQEIVGGCFGTTYTPVSRTAFNILDRILNIGVGTSDVDRKDGLSLFKNGLLLLPSITNALIEAASNKTVLTKEYFTACFEDGDNTTLLGTGTPTDPFNITANIQIVNGTGTTVVGNGITTPFQINIAPQSLILKGIITQSGTSNPIITIGKNTTGGTILSFIRDSQGEYTLTTSFNMPLTTTSYKIQGTVFNKSIIISRPTINTLHFKTSSTNGALVEDDGMLDSPFELLID